jgi:prepilin-type N-terminal cleavage/methylation domain-containing protein
MNYKLKASRKLGFSLVEMSVALVIVAIIMAAVAAGGQLIQKSRISGAQSLTKSSVVNSIENLFYWWESTSNSSFKSTEIENESIGTWYNLSGNQEAGDATAGNNPTYSENKINGLPALTFNGSSNYLSFNGNLLPHRNYTVAVVEQRLDDKSANYFIGGNDSGSTNKTLHLGYKENTTMAFNQFCNDYDITVDGFTSAQPKIHIFRYHETLGKNYYLNGISQTLTPYTVSCTVDQYQSLLSYNNAQIARLDSASNSFYYYGDIGEIIIFGKYLNDDEMNAVEKYLSKKWKITLN